MNPNQLDFVPVLPESAPFTPEQRAYLNGFLAGIFSRMPAPPLPNPQSQSPADAPITPISILFASQTGNAEMLAKRIAKEAGQRGFAPTVHDLAEYPAAQLASEKALLLVASTYGDGEPPDNAKAFWNFLSSPAAPRLPVTRFSVCALGDTNYPKFCRFGQDLDARLESLNATRVQLRADCDVDFEEPFAQWLNEALSGLAPNRSQPGATGKPSAVKIEPARSREPNGAQATAAYHRARPFPAALVTNRSLNGPGSQKDTRHFELALELPGLPYEAGDALGVVPSNCPELVAELLGVLGFSGDESVPGPEGGGLPLREALLRHYDIAKIPAPLLRSFAERSGDPLLNKLAAPGVNGELTQFLWGRQVVDLLLAFPEVKFAPAEFAALLGKLQPRLYSISSSPKNHPGQVHLTVNVVRYSSLGRARHGICSAFLAQRVAPGEPVPVFVQNNKNFRPPSGSDTPMIMVGPGTGAAPFRAFLQERRALGAQGKNWLFFGDQHVATDFLYRDELEGIFRDGLLTRLDTAFSRDQAEKLYVQHRMLERADELFRWLEDGAHFYVCGDATRMAKDVDAALHQVIQTTGGLNAEQAADYVSKLRAQKRYQRDVY